jgi:hypothetical protein
MPGWAQLTRTLSRGGAAATPAPSPMDGPGMPGSDGSGSEDGASADGSADGEGQPAGAGARSGGSDSADDAVEGEFKEV